MGKKVRIIRIGRAPLDADPPAWEPDDLCEHRSVGWVQDYDTNTRLLTCSDCQKVVRVEDGACSHTRLQLVEQYESRFCQFRCEICGYTVWDHEQKNPHFLV